MVLQWFPSPGCPPFLDPAASVSCGDGVVMGMDHPPILDHPGPELRQLGAWKVAEDGYLWTFGDGAWVSAEKG